MLCSRHPGSWRDSRTWAKPSSTIRSIVSGRASMLPVTISMSGGWPRWRRARWDISGTQPGLSRKRGDLLMSLRDEGGVLQHLHRQRADLGRERMDLAREVGVLLDQRHNVRLGRLDLLFLQVD